MILKYIIQSVLFASIGLLGLMARGFLLHIDMDKETALFIFAMFFLISFSICIERGH